MGQWCMVGYGLFILINTWKLLKSFSYMYRTIDSLSTGRCGNNFKTIIFKGIMQNNTLGTHCEIALRWMSHNLTNEKSTLVQVMAWCQQAPIYYLSQWWPRTMPPYGITRPQWVKLYRCHMICITDAYFHLQGFLQHRITLQTPNLYPLDPWNCQWNFRKVILKLILEMGDWGITCEIVRRQLPLGLINDKSTLVQVMAWCHQTTNHYLGQCWPTSMSPYCITWLQWVKFCCPHMICITDAYMHL